MAHELNNTDPSLARFLGAVRIDVRRNPELRAASSSHRHVRRERFFERSSTSASRRARSTSTTAKRVVVLIRVILIGLVDAVSDDPGVHRTAIDGIKRLIEGKLIRT